MIAAIYFTHVAEKVAKNSNKYFDCLTMIFPQRETEKGLEAVPVLEGECRIMKAKVWSSTIEEYGDPIQGRVCMAACREEEYRGEKQLIITAYVWQADTFPVEKFQPDLSGMPF